MTEKTVAEKRDGKLLGAVRKKALGYTFDESVEEYASVDGALQLVKKKVTKREAPPDVSAARLMLELSAPASDGYETMTEAQLLAEKQRLSAAFAREEGGEEKQEGAQNWEQLKMEIF